MSLITEDSTALHLSNEANPRKRQNRLSKRRGGRNAAEVYMRGQEENPPQRSTPMPLSSEDAYGGYWSSGIVSSEHAPPARSANRAESKTLSAFSLGGSQRLTAENMQEINKFICGEANSESVTAGAPVHLNVNNELSQDDEFLSAFHHHLQHRPPSPLYPPPHLNNSHLPPPSSVSLHSYTSLRENILRSPSSPSLTPEKPPRMPSKRRPPTPGALAANSPRRSFAKTLAEAKQNYPLPGLPSLPNATDGSSESNSNPLPTLPLPRHRSQGSSRPTRSSSKASPKPPPISSPLRKDEETSRSVPTASLNKISAPVGAPISTPSTNVTTTTCTTGLDPLLSPPNIASGAFAVTGSHTATTGVEGAVNLKGRTLDPQLSAVFQEDELPAVADETMRSLWRAKSSPSTPSEGTSPSSSSHFASSVMASLQSLHSATTPTPTSKTTPSNTFKTPATAGTASSSHRQQQNGFKASLSTPIPTEASPPVVPSTPLASSARSPPPAPLKLSKSLPGGTSSDAGSSSTVLPPSNAPGHRREGSTQYAYYLPTSVPISGSGASSSSTPTVPSSSATITFPASNSTLPADPNHQLPPPSPSTPRKKVSMKRLLAKPAPPSPSMSPPNKSVGVTKGTSSGSSPPRKVPSGTEERHLGSKSEDESKPRAKRRPSALELEEVYKKADPSEGFSVDGSGSKERSKSQRRPKPNEKDQLPGNHPHTTEFAPTHSTSPSPRPPLPGQRQRTSSENSRRDRSQSRSRRDRTNPSTPPSIPSQTAVSQLYPSKTSQIGEVLVVPSAIHSIWNRSPSADRTQKIRSTLNATTLGNQYIGIDYEPPSPSLDFSAALGTLGLGPRSSSPMVSKEKSRSPPSFGQDMESPLPKGKSSPASKNSTPTTPLTSNSATAQPDNLKPRLDRLLGVPISREPRKSALLMDVESALAGLAPKREEKISGDKGRRGRTGLLKKASRKFGSESSLTPSTPTPPSPHPSSLSRSPIPSPPTPSGGTWFSLGAPAAKSGDGTMGLPLLQVPSPRSRSFSRESPRPSPIREPATNNPSNPASRSSSVSRDAQKQGKAAPSNWKSPTEWMSGPQTGNVQPPPATLSPNFSKPTPPVPSNPFRSDSTSSSRANSPHLIQPTDSRSLKSYPSLPVSTPNSRAPSRLAESTGVTDIQSAITNGLSSSGTGTSSGDSPVVFVPMMLVDGDDATDDGLGVRGKTARLSVVAIGDKKDKKRRKEKDRTRVGSSPSLTPAASLIEEYKLKEMEREHHKGSKCSSGMNQRLNQLAKDRRSKSLVGLRDIFFGTGEGSNGEDSTDTAPKVDLSRYIQPSPQPSHQTTSSRATRTHSRSQSQALLRNSATRLSSSMSDSHLRGSFVAGESMRISGYGGTGPRIRGGDDQIRMMFAGGAVETGEDGGGRVSDDDEIFGIGRDGQPLTPLHGDFGTAFGGWASGRENGVDWSSRLDPLSKEKDQGKKEGLTQSLGRKVSINRWRRGSGGGPKVATSDEGHGSGSGHVSERESRAVEKMQASRRKRVASARRHEPDDKSRRSLRLSIDTFPEDIGKERLKRTSSEKPRHAPPPKGGKGLWRLVRRLSVNARDRSLMPPPPVPALPSGVPPPVPPKKSRSRSRKAQTRSSSPISSSDHASSSYHRTHSARSSTSSVYEPPPPLPKPPSALINAHIIQPAMLETVYQEPSPPTSSRFVSAQPSRPSKPIVENNWSAAFTRSSDPEIASLTLPPRRTPSKPTTKTPNVVSANTPRPSSMSVTLERTPRQDFDNESTRSGASGSPTIPTFSTEEPVNAFPKRLSGRLSNNSKASPTTPGSTMTGTNTSMSSPLDVNGEPIPFSLQLDSTTFMFPPSALGGGPPPPRPTRNSQRSIASTNPVRPRVYTADVPVDVMEFGSDSAFGSPTSIFQKYSGDTNPAKYLYRKSSGGLGVGNRLRVGGPLSHSRRRSSSYGGEGSDHSSPLSQSPYPMSHLASLPPPPATSRRSSPSASSPPDSFSRFTSHSVVHRPGTANTFGPSTSAPERHHETAMSLFDMHRSASTSSNPSSSSSINTAHTTTQDVNGRHQGRGLSPGTAHSPLALSPSVSSLRSSILRDSELEGLFAGGTTVHQAQRVVLNRRSLSDRATEAPNLRSEKEKHDRWEELMTRSEMAGGTLQMSVGLGLGLGADGL